MAKLTLPDILSGYLSGEKLNEALAAIEEWSNTVLSLDGALPNAMQADLDMGGYRLINIGTDPSDPEGFPTNQDVQDYVDSRASGLISQRVEVQTATASQTVFDLTTLSYTPGVNNLAVYVNGVRKFTPVDFAETSETRVTFVSGLTVGDKVTFVTNDFITTAIIPAHRHVWDDLISPPVYALRWPTWAEVTGKPTTFAPSTHEHDAGAITSGRLADARRGIYVQSNEPTGLGINDIGVLWFWGT